MKDEQVDDEPRKVTLQRKSEKGRKVSMCVCGSSGGDGPAKAREHIPLSVCAYGTQFQVDISSLEYLLFILCFACSVPPHPERRTRRNA